MMSESVAEIKKQLEEAASLPSFIAKYEADERRGVRNLVQKAKKQWIALQKEEERIEKMKFFEKKYAESMKWEEALWQGLSVPVR